MSLPSDDATPPSDRRTDDVGPHAGSGHTPDDLDAGAAMDATVARVLDRSRVVAVVGASPRPSRPSYGVMRTLIEHGYEVIPVTPHADRILGRDTVDDLASIPAATTIDVVDIFRRSDRAGAHVDEAIARGARAVWLQLGVIDHEAAERARAAGLDVVMDRCPAIELARRGGR